jgi:hypothetical protein
MDVTRPTFVLNFGINSRLVNKNARINAHERVLKALSVVRWCL